MTAMEKIELTVLNTQLWLLPEKAVYIEDLQCLLVADLHLGKSETFQQWGIPIPSQVNGATLARLQQLCDRLKPQTVFILGDLFHSELAMVDDVLEAWNACIQSIDAAVQLVIGNHDRNLIASLNGMAIGYSTDAIALEPLLLSHEPRSQPNLLNICGHVHPCLRLKTRLDAVRLPCFYFEKSASRLLLPSFGEFTGGYDVRLTRDAIAYAIVEQSLVEFKG